MKSIRYILIVGLILSLIVPVYAIEDLTNESYITPAYKIAINGDYKYKNDDINWYWAYPNFDNPDTYVNNVFTEGTLGTYPIYKKGDNVEFGICLESGFQGTLYLNIYYENENGVEFSDDIVVKEIEYSSQCADITVEMKNEYYGDIKYRWEFYSSGIWRYSDTYHLFLYENLNSNWKYRRVIQVSSAENLSEGTIKIKLNDTNFYDNSNTIYDKDDEEEGYSGTITDIVITDGQQTKVYPYFIDTYKGGYYNYSRESSNDTYIIIYVNENETAETLYLYYGYEIGYDYPYLFGYSEDLLNNPFGIYQVFSDWRWTKSFIEDHFNLLGGIYGKLERGNYYQTGQGHNSNIYFYKNNLTEIYFKYQTQGHDDYIAEEHILYRNSSNYLSHSKTEYYGDYFRRLYNSTNSYVGKSGTDYIVTAKIYYYNSSILKGVFNATYHNIDLNISEIQPYFTIYKLYLYDQGGDSRDYARNYYIKSKNVLSNSYAVGNETLTDYAIIQFSDMYEYDSFINDLWIGGYLTVDNEGSFYCFDNNGSVLGTIRLTKSLSGLTTYNIVFPYTLTNKTDFLNRTNFIYNCKFIADNGLSEEINNLTINFTTNRIFLDTIKPLHQNNYSSEYVAYNINSELNYTGFQTNFTAMTNKIQCTNLNDDGECLKYNYISNYYQYNSSNISTNYNYNEIKTMEVNNWYQQYYKFCRGGVCLSTPSRLFSVSKEETTISFPAEDYLDWNDTDVIEDEEFMNEMFWNNPLNYLSSFIYQNFIVSNTTANVQTIFLYVFLVFWNFLFILLVIAIYTYMKVQNLSLTLGVVLAGSLFLGYVGWISISTTTILIMVIAGIGLYLRKSTG